jgi:hypothetical protein
MQNTRPSLARRFVQTVAAALGLFLLAGCDVTITNLTPSSIPANPSSIYTISTRVAPKAINIVPGSLTVRIIIDGQSITMKRSDLGANIYELDYQLPANRNEIAYYFLVNYKFENNGVVSTHEEFTDVLRSTIVGRYVLSLEVNRGPVGARVNILGRGFTPQDTVTFDGTPARTVFESPNSIGFFVPAVDANRNYKIELAGANGNATVGTFRVDSTALSVSPSELSLRAGETQTITFTLPSVAPTGGQLLDVTTDAPESVIMPEIIVPAGSSSATVNVTGGKPGSGSLFLKGFGTGEITVPVTVR